MKYETIKEATQAWIGEMDAIQQGMVAKLMSVDIDDWREVTTPAYGDRVYVYEHGEGEIIEVVNYGVEDENDSENAKTGYLIELDEGTTALIECSAEDFEVYRYDMLPMWGTMWSFSDSCDNYWLEEGDGIKALSECGFRVYESEDFGYFFGVDGAGYDFYEAHWIPLYKARGLKWHKEN